MVTKPALKDLGVDSTEASSSTRAATKTALKNLGLRGVSTDFWHPLRAGRVAEVPHNVVVVASLSRVAEAFRATDAGAWTASLRIAKPSVVGLVQAGRDRVANEVVDHILRASEGRVIVCELRKPIVNSLTDCLAKAAAVIRPSGVVAVSYSDADRTLWLVFGDGLRGQVPWSALGLNDRVPTLHPETVRVGDDPETVEVSDSAGGKFEIDSASLRSLVDRETDARLRGMAVESAISLGQTLARSRSAKNLSQEDLAKRSGLTQEAISRLESGKHWPRIDTLRSYARGLGMSVGELLATSEVSLPKIQKAP